MPPAATEYLRRLRRMPSESTAAPPPPGAIEAFKDFFETDSLQDCHVHFAELLALLELGPGCFRDFYPILKRRLKDHVPFRQRELFHILSVKSKQKAYDGSPAKELRVLVAGAGPCGMRAAIETQLLGAETIIVEKREDFTRHNILKLWKFLIHDFKALGVKKFVGDFSTGPIDHVGIRTLQLFLVKVCLILGIRVISPVTLKGMNEPTEDGLGWTPQIEPETNLGEFDVVIVASGKKLAWDLAAFERRSLDAKLCIAVTANFVNGRSHDESVVQQISGVSRQYDQDFFKAMKNSTGIDLENIIYYRGETHYFVMTATRASLISKGVIKTERDDRDTLLAPDNVNREKLRGFAIEAAQFATGHFSQKLPVIEFARKSIHGQART